MPIKFFDETFKHFGTACFITQGRATIRLISHLENTLRILRRSTKEKLSGDGKFDLMVITQDDCTLNFSFFSDGTVAFYFREETSCIQSSLRKFKDTATCYKLFSLLRKIHLSDNLPNDENKLECFKQIMA